jgi:hypothetical protein
MFKAMRVEALRSVWLLSISRLLRHSPSPCNSGALRSAAHRLRLVSPVNASEADRCALASPQLSVARDEPALG